MDEAEKWLRENDPMYRQSRTIKDYPYLGKNRLKWAERHEIPFSAYSEKELEEIFAFGRKIS